MGLGRAPWTPVDSRDPTAERSFTAMYRANVDFVWRVARALGVAEANVDDVVHDVFFIVRRRQEVLEPDRPVRPWLAGITRNVAMHLQRKLARERRRLEVVEPPLPPRNPDEHVGLGEAAALIAAFVDSLDEDKRAAFVLCEIEGLSAVDVARVLELNVNTLYARLRAARVELDRFTERLRLREKRSADGRR
jgi:RNA polymerase sigma-70 factor, ECF subfamily